MSMRMLGAIKRLSVAVSLALSMWACGGDSRSSIPTSPTPAGLGPSYTLSGVVSEMTAAGLVPVEGVRVEERNLQHRATTDASGFYSISGLYVLSNSVSASKDGYEPNTSTVQISGDTRLDITVVRRVPHTLSGVVSEVTPTGLVPVEGVYVTGSWDYPVTTDSNGVFSISVCGDSPCLFYNGDRLSLYASKDGYQPGSRDVTINGDTWIDIQLVRR